MGALRRSHRALGSRGYFYYYFDPNHLRQRVIAYRRDAAATAGQPAESLLVVLNFSDSDAEVWLPFPQPGTWIEQLDGVRPQVLITQADQWSPVTVPSNYGAVYKRT
jgi:hypothetical protein